MNTTTIKEPLYFKEAHAFRPQQPMTNSTFFLGEPEDILKLEEELSQQTKMTIDMMNFHIESNVENNFVVSDKTFSFENGKPRTSITHRTINSKDLKNICIVINKTYQLDGTVSVEYRTESKVKDNIKL